jgi:uroporphyrinogen-III synthase
MINVLVSPGDRELVAILRRSGAHASIWPKCEIGAPTDNSSLHEAIENLFGYDWLILKNAPAAEYFLRAFLLKHQSAELDELRVLTLGTDAAEKVAAAQAHVDIALDDFRQGAVYREIESYVGDSSALSRQNLLMPSANIVSESFQDLFAQSGARLDAVAAYQTCPDKRELIRLKTLLAGGGIDFVVFTEESAVAEFAGLFDTCDLAPVVNSARVACLDQPTSDLAREYGLLEILAPSETSIPSLVEIITAGGD